MEDRRSVHYEKRHEEVVESGIDALSMALHNENEEEKASILFCLDKYLDPYYGYKLPYESDIIALLQCVFFENNSVYIKEDILDLLYYSTQPLDILENRLDELSGELLSHARRLLYNL